MRWIISQKVVIVLRRLLTVTVWLSLVSCAGTMAPERPKESSNLLRGKRFVAEIPVVRPSTQNAAQLEASAVDLVNRYRWIENSVAYRENGNLRRANIPVTDAEWLKWIKSYFRGKVEGWNYDPGTTAQIYLGLRGGVGSPITGKILLVKDGELLGFTDVVGSRSLYGYYRAMSKLGIFIP